MPIEGTFEASVAPEIASLPLLPPDELLEKAFLVVRGEPETFGATPLDHQVAYEQQYALHASLKEDAFVDIPDDIPASIAGYVEDTFSARFYGRGTANHENYLTALYGDRDFHENILAKDMVERAKIGLASPAELLLVREMLGIRSAELACLTHTYGKRIELLEPMRRTVRESVELLGGEYDSQPETRYRIKGAVNEIHWEADYSEGFFMTRKRTLGLMPDNTTIRERTSFILRSDAIPAENLAAIRELDAEDPNWQDEAVRVGHLDTIAAGLLEADEFSLVIPISTTIYAFNSDTAIEIERKQKREHDERGAELRRDMRERFPTLLAHLEEAREAQDVARKKSNKKAQMKNVGDMLYVNSNESDSEQ